MKKPIGFGATVLFGLLSIARCSSDSTPGSNDASNDVTTQSDASNDAKSDVSTKDATPEAAADGEAGPPPPTPDGGISWFQHFNTNTPLYDVSASDPQGNVVIVGGLRTCAGCGNAAPDFQTHVGGFSLPAAPPSVRVDPLIAKLNPSGVVVWARSPATTAVDAGGFLPNEDVISSVAVDSNGDIYIAGVTGSASITLKDTLAGPCTFVAKMSGDGTTYVWDRAYPTTYSPYIAVSGNKLAFATSYEGMFEYDSGKTVTSLGYSDVFAALLSTSDGSTTWHQTLGGTSGDTANAVTITTQGDVIVGGQFQSATLAGNGAGFPLNKIGTIWDGFVAKLAAADGSGLYTLAYGDTTAGGAASVYGVAYANGILAITGYFSGTTVDFGQGNVASALADGFLVAYDESKKKPSFVSILRSDHSDQLNSAAFDPWGNILATGYYGSYGSSTAQLGTTSLPNSTFYVQAFVVAKFDPSGNVLWANPYVPSMPDGGAPYVPADFDGGLGAYALNGSRISVSTSGATYVAGGMNLGAFFGSLGYQPRLSTLVEEYSSKTWAADGIVGAWAP